MRIPSGVTDQYIYFVAVDATDLKTRETGLSGFTVRRSRNGGASAAYTTPTVNETDTTNMPGVYELLLDEDMTIDAGDKSQEVCLHITHASMAPVTRVFELYRPDVTAAETLTVASGIGQASVQSIAANAITAAATATDFGTEVGTAVWATTTRVLTAGTNIALAKGTGVTGFNDLSAAQVNAEVDTALADYDGPTNAEMVARTLVAADYATATAVADVPTNAELATALGTADDAVLAQVALVKAKTDNLPIDPASTGTISGLIDVTNALVQGVPTNAEFEARTILAAEYATATALATVDTVADGIKAKTDSLTFTTVGQVDANIQYVNDVEVTGNGETGTEWGPA
jgi:hypothetical protein